MNRFIAVVAFVAVCSIALERVQSLAVDTPMGSQQGTITVPLLPVSSSGQSGSATLTSTADGKTQVVIALTGADSATAEPAHIHPGTCARLNPKPVYPLANLLGGTSTTIVPVTLSSLETGGFSINVHQSTSNLGTYVACGTIPAVTTGAGAAPAPMST
jgi:hypothetical protein